jgi:hypothetical protein
LSGESFSRLDTLIDLTQLPPPASQTSANEVVKTLGTMVGGVQKAEDGYIARLCALVGDLVTFLKDKEDYRKEYVRECFARKRDMEKTGMSDREVSMYCNTNWARVLKRIRKHFGEEAAEDNDDEDDDNEEEGGAGQGSGSSSGPASGTGKRRTLDAEISALELFHHDTHAPLLLDEFDCPFLLPPPYRFLSCNARLVATVHPKHLQGADKQLVLRLVPHKK